MWTLGETDDYERCRKWYAKKRPHELAAVTDNVEAYFGALESGASPLQISGFGYVHDERQGVYAVDQKHSGSKRKLAQTRLYVYPELDTKTLHLLKIGDKNDQKTDIADCHDFVSRRRKELEDEKQKRAIQEREGDGPKDVDSG